jgi:large subunit ribosomal protein L10
MNQDVRKAKQEVVDKFVKLAKGSTTIVIAEYRGLTVAQAQELRRALRAQGAQMFVFKNSLVERAAKELGYEGLDELLSGPNAFFFSEELSSSAKVVSKYAKRFGDSLKIKGGLVEGKVIDANGVKEVANMPGREGLLAMFLSCLQAPVRQFACAVKAVADAK